MNIGIIDADLIGRDNHRFPNLACEKISAYWKNQNAKVDLLLNFHEVQKVLEPNLIPEECNYDKIYISKVFTDTWVPDYVQDLVSNPDESGRILIGGTGFYFDKAPDLDYVIEHQKPDYNLYNKWIERELDQAEIKAKNAGKPFNRKQFMVQFKEYTDYSIGFLTRGCFRKCGFCVNQKYDRVFSHSPLEEFLDESRKKICLLDDNIMGSGEWRKHLQSLVDAGKPFKFKQGMDERILTDEKCKILFSSKYDGDYTFAFDNIADYELIKTKLELIKKYAPVKASIKFYVLVGYESTDEQDVVNAFKRIELLMRYGCLPYIMRYQNKNFAPWKHSINKGMYIAMARWANQPSLFKKKSFRQFCELNQMTHKSSDMCAPMRAMNDFQKRFPLIAEQYFDLRFDDFNKNKRE